MNAALPLRCSTCFQDMVRDGRCGACGAVQAEPNRHRRALPVGTVIDGKYVIGRMLGSGGFGITYLAQDMRLGRRVALKEFFPGGLATRESDHVGVTCNVTEDEPPFRRGLDRFFLESRILARFDHPNIVRVHDVIEAHGTAYLAMEYLDGQTLKSWIKSAGRLPEEKALQVIGFVIDALKAVHEARVVHRDVKPDNVYITSAGRTLLLDFGGAKQLTGEGDKSMDAMFAHGYAAPEQYRANSGRVGPWTDVYACGATLYKMLTGVTLPSAIERSPQDPPLDWSDANVSTGMRKAVERALSLSEADRFQSVRDLERALSGDAPLEVARLPGRRNWVLAGIGAVALGVAVVAVAAWRAGSPSPQVTTSDATLPPPTQQQQVQAPKPVHSSASQIASANPPPVSPPAVPPAEVIKARLKAMVEGAANGDWAYVEESLRALRGTLPEPRAVAAVRSSSLSSGLQSIERKDYGAACSELERAASEDSSDWRILLALGHARLRLGQFEQARTALTRSLFIQPDDANAWLRMSEIQAVKGDTAGSRAALRLAIYLSHQRTRALDYLDNADDNTLAPQFQTIVHAERGALDKLPRRTS